MTVKFEKTQLFGGEHSYLFSVTRERRGTVYFSLTMHDINELEEHVKSIRQDILREVLDSDLTFDPVKYDDLTKGE